MIATPECSSETITASITESPTAKITLVPIPIVHYHLSSFLAHQVERLQIRSEEVDAMAESKSVLQAVGAKPPEGNIPTTSVDIGAIAAEQPDMRPIGAHSPEHPSTNEVPEAQLGASALPSTTKKTTPQQMIYRYKNESQPAFLHMCRSVPGNLP